MCGSVGLVSRGVPVWGVSVKGVLICDDRPITSKDSESAEGALALGAEYAAGVSVVGGLMVVDMVFALNRPEESRGCFAMMWYASVPFSESDVL